MRGMVNGRILAARGNRDVSAQKTVCGRVQAVQESGKATSSRSASFEARATDHWKDTSRTSLNTSHTYSVPKGETIC